MIEMHQCPTLNQIDRVQRFRSIDEDEPIDASENHNVIGGEKHLERPTWAAAFNHIDVVNLIDHVFKRMRWEYPEDVQLFVCGEDDDRYKIYDWESQKWIDENAFRGVSD